MSKKQTENQEELMTAVGKYRRMRANGGNVLHLVPFKEYAAVCGYQPSSPNGYLIRGRGRWASSAKGQLQSAATLANICPKCMSRLKRKLSKPI